LKRGQNLQVWPHKSQIGNPAGGLGTYACFCSKSTNSNLCSKTLYIPPVWPHSRL